MDQLEQDLDRYREARLRTAGQMETFADALTKGDEASALTLPEVAAMLRSASETLRSGTFRLMLLGDMKRGKSTLLNALLGEDLLPARVTPCTAIITVVRHGESPEVVVEYGGRPAESITVQEFKSRFTIPADEAKSFEETGTHTFPDVERAVLSYPLELLEKNVEFVDTPGLNDTEERNRITFDYLPRCHAVLFVFSATQPFTRAEMEYLQEHLSNRGYTIFFLINYWNQLKDSVLRPEDLPREEERLRRLLRQNLSRYCAAAGGGDDLYEKRVFEIDALGALRGRQRGAGLSEMPETGMPRFLDALDEFLLNERGRTELFKASGTLQLALERVEEAATRRMQMLRQPVEELRERVARTEPRFAELQEIKSRIEQTIALQGEQQAEGVATDFVTFLTDLHQSFEAEFPTFAPPVRLGNLFTVEKRQEFEQSVNDAFRRYMASKVDGWKQRNDRRLLTALKTLEQDIGGYGRDYQAVVEQINQVVGGVEAEGHASLDTDQLPVWTRYAAGANGLTSGDVSTTGVGALEWKEIVLNLGAVVGLNILMSQLLGAFAAGPIGMIVSAALVAGAQLRQSMEKMTTDMRARLQEQLPEFAKENRPKIKAAVEEAFACFQEKVTEAVQRDIDDLRHELRTMVSQMESREFDARAAEEQITTLLQAEKTGLRSLAAAASETAASFRAASLAG